MMNIETWEIVTIAIINTVIGVIAGWYSAKNYYKP